MRNLIMLMLIQGLSCLMLSSKQVLNMWVIQPLVPAYFDTSWDTELMQPVTYSQ
jgi:membrane-associated HD superfamily phosphohydrolase